MNWTGCFATVFVFILNGNLSLTEGSCRLLFLIQFLNIWCSRFILLKFSYRILFYWSSWCCGWILLFLLWGCLLLNRRLLNWYLSWRWTNMWSRLLCCSFRWKGTSHLIRSSRSNLCFTLSQLFHFSLLILQIFLKLLNLRLLGTILSH